MVYVDPWLGMTECLGYGDSVAVMWVYALKLAGVAQETMFVRFRARSEK